LYAETSTAPTEPQAAPATPNSLPPLPDTSAEKPAEYDSDEDQKWENALFTNPGEAATTPAPAITVTEPVPKRRGPTVQDSDDGSDDSDKVVPKTPTEPVVTQPTPSITVTKPATKPRPRPFQQDDSSDSEDAFEKPVERKNTKPSRKPAATTPVVTKPAAKVVLIKPAPGSTHLENLLKDATAGAKPLPTKPAAINSPRAKISLSEYTAIKSPTSAPAATQPLDKFPAISSAVEPTSVVRRSAPASRPQHSKAACQPLVGTHGVDQFSGDEDEGEDSDLSEHDDEVIKVYETEEATEGVMRKADEAARIAKEQIRDQDFGDQE
jgi:hypothetical protein